MRSPGSRSTRCGCGSRGIRGRRSGHSGVCARAARVSRSRFDGRALVARGAREVKAEPAGLEAELVAPAVAAGRASLPPAGGLKFRRRRDPGSPSVRRRWHCSSPLRRGEAKPRRIVDGCRRVHRDKLSPNRSERGRCYKSMIPPMLLRRPRLFSSSSTDSMSALRTWLVSNRLDRSIRARGETST